MARWIAARYLKNETEKTSLRQRKLQTGVFGFERVFDANVLYFHCT